MNMTTIVEAIVQSTTVQALGLAAMILFFGFRLLQGIRPDSPFAPYSIQILALIIIVPVVMSLVLTTKFPSEAATGLIGTIVGFFFGGASQRQQGPPVRPVRTPLAESRAGDQATPDKK